MSKLVAPFLQEESGKAARLPDVVRATAANRVLPEGAVMVRSAESFFPFWESIEHDLACGSNALMQMIARGEFEAVTAGERIAV